MWNPFHRSASCARKHEISDVPDANTGGAGDGLRLASGLQGIRTASGIGAIDSRESPDCLHEPPDARRHVARASRHRPQMPFHRSRRPGRDRALANDQFHRELDLFQPARDPRALRTAAGTRRGPSRASAATRSSAPDTAALPAAIRRTRRCDRSSGSRTPRRSATPMNPNASASLASTSAVTSSGWDRNSTANALPASTSHLLQRKHLRRIEPDARAWPAPRAARARGAASQSSAWDRRRSRCGGAQAPPGDAPRAGRRRDCCSAAPARA